MDINFFGILVIIILLIPKIWYEYWLRNSKRNRKKRKKNFKNSKNKNKKNKKYKKSSNINELLWNWYSVQEFRRKTKKGYTQYDFNGVYVIHDLDLDFDMYYVGQSVNVIKRLRGHFNGQASKGGADDLNEALINGDNMEIALLRLKNSSFRDLDDMEAYFIDYFDAYYHGYNRTRGNYIELRTMGPIHKGGHHVKSFSLR